MADYANVNVSAFSKVLPLCARKGTKDGKETGCKRTKTLPSTAGAAGGRRRQFAVKYGGKAEMKKFSKVLPGNRVGAQPESAADKEGDRPLSELEQRRLVNIKRHDDYARRLGIQLGSPPKPPQKRKKVRHCSFMAFINTNTQRKNRNQTAQKTNPSRGNPPSRTLPDRKAAKRQRSGNCSANLAEADDARNDESYVHNNEAGSEVDEAQPKKAGKRRKKNPTGNEADGRSRAFCTRTHSMSPHAIQHSAKGHP